MRGFIRFNRRFPLALYFIGVVFGQLLAFLWGYGSIWVWCFQALFLRKSIPFTSSILIGALSALIFLPAIESSQPEESDALLVKVIESPRFRRPGEIEISMEILGKIISETIQEKESNQFKLEPKFRSLRYVCKAADLPWKNINGSRNGDLLSIRAKFAGLDPLKKVLGYKAMLRRHGFSGTCKIRYASKPINRDIPLWDRIRENIKKYVERKIGPGEVSGLPLSMSIGTKDVLTPKTEEAFKKTGLAHILVVSGFQVTLVYSFLSFFFFLIVSRIRCLVHRIPAIYISTVFSLLGVYGFIALVGLDGPVVRAGIAISVYSLSKLFERGRDPLNSIINSALVISLVSPGAYLEPGVELSFGALLGLFYGDQVGKKPFSKFLYSSLFASTFTSIISFIWFGRFSVISLFINPILAPLLSFLGCKMVLLALFIVSIGIDSKAVLLKGLSKILEKIRDSIVEISNLDLVVIENIYLGSFVSIVLLLLSIFLIVKSCKATGTIPNQ